MSSFFIIILIGVLLYIFLIFLKPVKVPKKAKNKDPNICILVPARDESKVIYSLLESIKNQDYPILMNNVFVIVESKNDKTVEIAKNMGCEVFVREDLHLKSKGYALNEVITKLKLYKKNYDLFFVFDADNILKNDFIKKMIPAYKEGYQLAMGCRKNKNPLSSNISDASVLTFRIIDFINKNRMKNDIPILVAGSCFYMTNDLVKKWRGFPFYSISEDYELSLYALVNDISATQVIDAHIFDEQPDYNIDSKNQKLRLIRGYLNNQRDYRMKLLKKMCEKHLIFSTHLSDFLGVLPLIFILTGIFGMMITSFGFFIASLFQSFNIYYLFHFLILFISFYLILAIFGIFLLIKDNGKYPWYHNLRIVGYFPIFLLSYVPCFISVLFHKNLEWKKIEHRVTSYKA